MRERFAEQFKATVPLEAVKEEQTLQEPSEKYQVHPNQISVWKKKLLQDSAALFERKNKKDEEYNRLNRQRSGLIDRKETRLSVRKQCFLLGVTRSRLYYCLKPGKPIHAKHHEAIGRIAEAQPFYCYRHVTFELQSRNVQPSWKQVRLIRNALHIKTSHAKRNTSVKHPLNPIYPYLLKCKEIRHPNQVWCTDLAYIKLPEVGYVYLAAVLDLYSRKVLSWKVSNSMGSRFCEEALREALETYGAPAIFNTDQGSQFTSNTCTRILHEQHVRISIDGRDDGGTMCISNGSGGRSNTMRFFSADIKTLDH